MSGSLLIALALLGQPPGAARPISPPSSRPVPAAVPFVPGATQAPLSREWIDAVSQVDGQVYRISGWREADGSARFDPREYPDFVPRDRPAPAPVSPGPHGGLPFPRAGVVPSKMPRPVAGQGWFGGNVVKPVESAGYPSKGQLPDVNFCAIGTPAEKNAVRERLKADPAFAALQAQMGDRLAVQYYDKTNPMVARVGLVDGGHPDVVVLDAGGKEMFRRHDDPGPATIIEAIRKADPTYKPGRDDAAGPLIPFSAGTILGAFVVAGLAYAFYKQSARGQP